MIISDEQVRGALRYLHTTECGDLAGSPCATGSVPVDLLERISDRLRMTPETRSERVEAARAAMIAGGPTSEDVAAKIIGRAISDSVR
jgi:hypothetical protein